MRSNTSCVRSVRGGRLHYGGLLVYLFHIVCESGGGTCPFADRYLFVFAAVVGHFGGLEGLKRPVGIHAGGGPLATAEIAGAEEHGAVDAGRGDVGAAEPEGIDGGQGVAANAVGGGVDLGTREVGEPALFVGVVVLPLLDLEELLTPVDVGVAEEVVDVALAAPGFVGVRDEVWKSGQ